MIRIERSIVVVLPSKNDEKTIAEVVRECQDVIKKHNLGKGKVLVISDSDDNTDKNARNAGAIVVRGGGRGLGAAMFLGLKEAVRLGGDIILSMDADGQSNPSEIPNFVNPIINNEADFVVGSRFLEPDLIKYKMEFSHLIGNKILAWFIRRISKQKITDSHGGLRAMRREVADSLEMIGTHTYVQETIIDAAQRKFRIKEIPSVWLKRKSGKTKVVSSVKKYALWMFPVLVLRTGVHMMLFPAIGGLLILSGFIFGGYLFWAEAFDFTRLFARIPALILVTLLILSGIQLFFFGYILDITIRTKNLLDRVRK